MHQITNAGWGICLSIATAVFFAPYLAFCADVVRGDQDESRPRLVANLSDASRTNAVAFSPDGEVILIASWSRIQMIEKSTGRQLASFSIPDKVTAVGYSSDGKKVWAVGDTCFYEWAVDSRALRLERVLDKQSMAYASSVAYVGGKAQLLLQNRRTGQVAVVDAETGETSDAYLTVSDSQTRGVSSGIRGLLGIGSHPGSFKMQSAISPVGDLVFTARDHIGGERLWQRSDGRELLELSGIFSDLRPFAFSTDSRQLAVSASGTNILLWDLPDTKAPRELRLPSGFRAPPRLLFHPDDKSLLCMSDSIGKLISLDDGTVLQAFNRDELLEQIDAEIHLLLHEASFDTFDLSRQTAAFSPDGSQLLLTTDAGDAVLWDVASGKRLKEYDRPTIPMLGTTFSPNDDYLAAYHGTSIYLWDCKSGSLAQSWIAHGVPTFLVFSADGRLLFSGSEDGTIGVWETWSGKLVTRLGRARPNSSETTSTDFDFGFVNDDHPPNDAAATRGNKLIVGYFDAVVCWDVTSGDELWRAKVQRAGWFSLSALDFTSLRNTLRLSPHGQTFLYDGILWNANTGEKLRSFRRADGAPNPEQAMELFWMFNSDGTQVISAVGVFDAETGQLLHDSVAFPLYDPIVDNPREFLEARPYIPVILPACGQYCAVELFFEFSSGSGDGVSALLPLAMKKTPRLFRFEPTPQDRTGTFGKLCDLDTEEHAIFSATLSHDRSRLVTAELDGRVRVWDTGTGKQLCTVFFLSHGAWAVVDPDGRFDASNGGSVDELHWVVGSETINLGQLKNRYYEPGLLAKVLGHNDEPVRNVGAFKAPKLFPDVQVAVVDRSSSTFRVTLTNQGGGIGRVAVKVNGKEVTADARSIVFDPQAAEASIEISLAGDPRLIGGVENLLEVEAFNAEGYLRSRGASVVFEPMEVMSQTRPELYGLVVGVSDYRGDAIDLHYAAKDAADFATALRLASSGLFGIEHSHIELLSSIDVSPERSATRRNVIAGLEKLAERCKPQDILVLYLAGHGLSYGSEAGDFYFLVQDAHTADLADPEVRQQASISSEELTAIIRKSPALKQVMILDTCASGKFVDKFTERRDVPSSQIRALERVKDRTGIHILAGCAADRVSYETTTYAQGLLTYSLLAGMRGAALREEQFVDVGHLFNYAADQVPELAKGIGGIQRPILAVPRGGASFDIGRLTSKTRSQIPLQPALPLVLRASFQDEGLFRDWLGIGDAVNEELRAATTRGPSAVLVFVDANDFPDACELVGRYHVNTESVSVRVLLARGDEDVGNFVINGNTQNVTELARSIVARATIALKDLHLEDLRKLDQDEMP
ncbi:MAG: caspase family protein [Planctomycetaceae bacterium]|nr:caspase family protein [Planctomycetales bacterium]MCB9923046.1 caspase family protein [Planctomycetaceae bacterium]